MRAMNARTFAPRRRKRRGSQRWRFRMTLDPPALPDPPARISLYRILVEYNPFYLLSAMCMLAGVFALNNSLDYSPLPLPNLITLIVTLNCYEAMLIGLAVFLLRRGIRRDALWL